ncbi:MAG: VWA domain-containing protein [Spirochaetes bacterium]|nr:VWA domain-containing protein [Spirochaetota bacterium]
MSFLWPKMLWLLTLLPLLVALYVWIQKRKKRFAWKYSNLSIVKEAASKGPGRKRHIPAIVVLMGLALLIFGLARPTATVILPSFEGLIILALDNSGSMRAEDVKPNRLDAAKAAAKTFVEQNGGRSKIGVVGFAGTASLVQPPTKDKELIFSAINRLTYQRGTAIGSGILTSLNAILEEFGEKQIIPQPYGSAQTSPSSPSGSSPSPTPSEEEAVSKLPAMIVLLSDGQSNTGPLPLEMADIAAKYGIKVYTVGLGSPEGVVLNFNSFSFRVRLDEETLKKIAEKTGGSYYKADNETNLNEIYQNLGRRLTFKPEKTEITALFAAAAGVLFLMGMGLSIYWFGRVF